jgi:hypothetical protein
MKRTIAIVVFLFAWSLTTHGKYSVTGDEPHFLMITRSVVADNDLDLLNNYQNNDGRLFGHDQLEMGLHAVPSRRGEVRPNHDIGLAIAVAPAYLVGRQLSQLFPEPLLARFRMDRGLFTYSIIGLFLISLTVFGLLLLYEALTTFASTKAAGLLVIAAGVSPPIVSHSFLVFPEILALFVTNVVVWAALTRRRVSQSALMATMFLLGVLPWTHHKYVPYVFGLLFVLLWKRWQLLRSLPAREWLAAAGLFVFPQLALHMWTWQEWGTLSGTLTTGDQLPFSLAVAKNGLIGLGMDRHAGLLAFAPLYWVVPACFYLARKDLWPFLVPAALLYVPAAAFTHGWNGGFSPAARYIVPLVPFAVAAVAHSLRYGALRFAVLALAVPQVVIDVVVWQYPRTLWPSPAGNAALQSLGPIGRAYEQLLPAAQAGQSTGVALLLAVAVSAGLVALTTFGSPLRRDQGRGVDPPGHEAPSAEGTPSVGG